MQNQLRLPLIYGEKATPIKDEQLNRLKSLWFCEAQRAADADDRVEAAKTKKENIYVSENRRLEQLLRRKHHDHKPKRKKAKPRIVQDMIALEYRYQKSAKVVQKAWRRYSSRSFWQRYFQAVRAATEIQVRNVNVSVVADCAKRRIRGVLCRKYVRIWYLSRIRFATVIQAVYRGHLTRRVLHTKIEWENYNANVIQRWTRGYFGRKRAEMCRETMAVVHIQCLWRGYSSRKISDRLWLGSKATPIQALMRGFLARRRCKCLALRYHTAAMSIQRVFRGVLAKNRIDNMLRDRETQNRKIVMDVLDAEIAWFGLYIDKLERRLAKTGLRESVVELEVELQKLHIQINDMECIYLDMKEQKAKMSPRAITDGWLCEMEAKMTKQRRNITTAKYDAVFGLGYTFKKNEAQLQARNAILNQAIFKRDQLIRWRTEEYLDYWTREMKHLAIERTLARQRNIAEQRRKWTVKFYTPSGKVQIKQPMPKVDTTFTMANTNILAHTAAGDNPTIASLTDQVKLVAVQSQLAQAQAMFNPLIEQFSGTHNAVHGVVRETAKPVVHEMPPEPTNEVAVVDKQLKDGDEFIPEVKQPTLPPQAPKLVPKSAQVPWALLDQLEAEKIKFKTEQALRKTSFLVKK